MMENHTLYFKPWDNIHESNPQEILDRHENITLVPLLIMAGALDDNVLPEIQEKFVASYRAAGGECQFQLFEGAEHEWVAKAGSANRHARARWSRLHRPATEVLSRSPNRSSPDLCS